MAKIKILDETVAGRIAAGEVVERPASIIKELVENSIDAGASAVSVSIQEGGIRSIKVTDNGGGISKEDMPLTVIKHATSKLETVSDLEKIYTMGFRGEALFSISAVSMMKISSRVKGEDFGTTLLCEGGKVKYIEDAGVPEGTSVIVENLFYNTPARLKFLKRPSVEAAAITDLIAKLILSHPEISIKYLSNDTVIYHSSGNGDLKDCISLIYGKEARDRLITIENSFGELKLSGYIGQPDLCYKTRKNCTVFVNNRYIKSDLIEGAVLRGCGERYLKGTFPFYCLKLTMPAGDVDVNVHPNKLFVKFRDDKAIDYLIYSTVADAIKKQESAILVNLEDKKERKDPPAVEKRPVSPITYSQPKTDEQEDVKIIEEKIRSIFAPSDYEPPQKAAQYPDYERGEKPLEPSYDFSSQLDKVYEKENEMKDEAAEQIPIFSESSFSYKIIGTLFNTYIVVEVGEKAYLIDQHALHERLLYDEISEKSKNPAIIYLLISETVTLSHQESVVLEDNLPLLKEMGFGIEEFGPLTYKIDSVPKACGEMDIRALLGDILSTLESGSKDVRLRRDKIARAACRAAVKGGDILTEEQIVAFLKQIDETGAIVHCPHGRPIFTVLTKAQLEKSFKRRL